MANFHEIPSKTNEIWTTILTFLSCCLESVVPLVVLCPFSKSNFPLEFKFSDPNWCLSGIPSVRGPHLPHMVHYWHVFGQHHGPKDPHHAIQILSIHVWHLKHNWWWLNRAVTADIKGFDNHRTFGLLEANEGLRSDHACACGIDGPCNPPIGSGWLSNEGKIKGWSWWIIGPMEVRIECWEIIAQIKGFVAGKFLWRTCCRMAGDGNHQEKRKEKQRSHWSGVYLCMDS